MMRPMQPASATAPIQTDAALPWVERHLPVLDELVQIGMELARAIRRQAIEPGADGTPPDAAALANGFARVSRAVRQTVALGKKLDEEQRQRTEEQRRREALRAAARQPTAGQWGMRRLAHRDHMAALLPKALDRAYEEASEEACYDLQWLNELGIRIASLEYDPLANDPSVAETVERISRQLCVPFDPAVWYDAVPQADTGAEPHPAVAATIAHKQRDARKAQQDGHIDRLVDIFETPPDPDDDEDEIEALEFRLAEAMERMEAPDYDPLLGDRSIAEIVEQVSQMLGVPFDPAAWQEQVPEVEIGGEIRPLSWPSRELNETLAAELQQERAEEQAAAAAEAQRRFQALNRSRAGPC